MRAQYAVIAASLAVVIASSSGCKQLEARDNLNKGVQSFKGAQYAAAVDYFKTAVDLDPKLPMARLYLATAYEMQYIPGADSPDNMRFANAAMDQFHKVLDIDPKNVLATSSIASLYYNEKKFDQAEEWNKKVIAIDPKNKEAYYTLGVLAWTNWLPVDRQARLDSHQTATDPGPIKDAKIRNSLKEKWLPILDGGIKDEERAIQIDPEYDDAMTYMNLLIRYKGDLLDTTEEWKKASDEADKWMTKSLETKKITAQKKADAAANGATKTE
jgi:tetratricopeptide (TPR) repeat protein